MPAIISVSRRTDVPAFYSDWFMARVREGSAGYVNPFSGKRHSVSLLPEDVAAIVFWSKNYAPLMPYLDELDALGYKMIFHFTITGYPQTLEEDVPPWGDSIDIAHTLAARYSPSHVLWRFDPVIFSTITPPEKVIENFTALAVSLEGAVSRCYFSFVCHYGKVRRNFEELYLSEGVKFRVDAEDAGKFEDISPESRGAFVFDLSKDDKRDFAGKMAEIASLHGISMHSCCGDYLIKEAAPAISKAHCIDWELIANLNGAGARVGVRPTREECGCYASVDVGAYDTCPHGCIYCYANANKAAAIKKRDALSKAEHLYALRPGARRSDFPETCDSSKNGEPGQPDLELS